MKNIKNQKGAISLFVILAMLFFLAFILGAYSIASRRNSAQLETVRETAKIYSSGVDANSLYDSMLATTPNTTIPITTFEQLKEAKRVQENATLQTNYTINGKLYTYKKGASYVLANDIILNMESEIHGKSDISIYDYILYDKNNYNIDLNNHNIYYKLKDGSLWKCIFYQDIGTSQASANKFTSANAGKCYTADKYSILANGIDEFRQSWSSNTNYEFLLTYSCVSGKFDITNKKYQRWKQTNNPTKETCTEGDGSAKAVGYESVTEGLGTGNFWGGLTLSSPSAVTSCYLNGSVGHGNWFYAVGAYSWHSTYGIPSSDAVGGSARECLLFVRIK